jgi:hypothetical protein
MGGSETGRGVTALIGRLSVSAEQVLIALVAINLLATTGDVAIAHAFNEFALDTQYLPFIIGGFAGIAALIAIPGKRGGKRRTVFVTGMWSCVALGLLGFWWHLESQLVWRGAMSLKTYVYTAPLAAPMAYAGIATIGLVAASKAEMILGWTKRQWVYFLVAGGSLGNASLCVLDHARNGFINPTEWIPIPVTLFTAVLFFGAAVRPVISRVERAALWIAVGVQILVGGLGWGLHVYFNLTAETGNLLHRVVYGPPIFSPLLLADVAAFGAVMLLFPFISERDTSSETE